MPVLPDGVGSAIVMKRSTRGTSVSTSFKAHRLQSGWIWSGCGGHPSRPLGEVGNLRVGMWMFAGEAWGPGRCRGARLAELTFLGLLKNHNAKRRPRVEAARERWTGARWLAYMRWGRGGSATVRGFCPGDGSSTTTVAVIPLSGRPVVESLTSQHRFEVHARPVVPLTTGWICRSEQPGILAARRYERVWLGAVTSRRG